MNMLSRNVGGIPAVLCALVTLESSTSPNHVAKRSLAMYRCLILLVVGMTVPSWSMAEDKPPGMPESATTTGRVSAPIVYEGLALVVTSDNGTAAIAFTEKLAEGRAYKFRYESKDGATKTTGEGKVFEKYKRVPGDKPNQVYAVDEGSELHLKAGPVSIEWSFGGEDRGWIYYTPESTRVQIASAKDFERINLAAADGLKQSLTTAKINEAGGDKSAFGKPLFTNVVKVMFAGSGFPANSDGKLGGLVADDGTANITIYEHFIVRELVVDKTTLRTVYSYDKLGMFEQQEGPSVGATRAKSSD